MIQVWGGGEEGGGWDALPEKGLVGRWGAVLQQWSRPPTPQDVPIHLEHPIGWALAAVTGFGASRQ